MDRFERAEQTIVFEHPAPPGHPDDERANLNRPVTILAQPGQQLNRDPEFLRKNFGILPEHARFITTLAKSRARPLTDDEKAVERAAEAKANVAFAPGAGVSSGGISAEEAADLKARVARLEELLGAEAPSAKK
jgi:hypothetical protein